MRKRLCLLALIILGGCGQDNHQQSTPVPYYKPPTTAAEVESRIAGDASWIETKKDFPDDFAKFGEDGMSRINGLTFWAGVAALSNSGCDYAEQSALSGNSDVDSPQWFVDCKDGARIIVPIGTASATKAKWWNKLHDPTQPIP